MSEDNYRLFKAILLTIVVMGALFLGFYHLYSGSFHGPSHYRGYGDFRYDYRYDYGPHRRR